MVDNLVPSHIDKPKKMDEFFKGVFGKKEKFGARSR